MERAARFTLAKRTLQIQKNECAALYCCEPCNVPDCRFRALFFIYGDGVFAVGFRIKRQSAGVQFSGAHDAGAAPFEKGFFFRPDFIKPAEYFATLFGRRRFKILRPRGSAEQITLFARRKESFGYAQIQRANPLDVRTNWPIGGSKNDKVHAVTDAVEERKLRKIGLAGRRAQNFWIACARTVLWPRLA